MTGWTLCDLSVEDLFGSMDQTEAVEGTEINSNWMSRLVRVESGDEAYYAKIYASRGRGLRRFLGRSRVRAEWENLAVFKALGIKTADVVAFGEETCGEYRGAVVSRELRGTTDLAQMARQNHELLGRSEWRRAVIRRLSAAVRALHNDGFVHNDLKWRNILVTSDSEPEVYLIDCPMGRKLWGLLLHRGIIKDLACLDKVGKKALSRTDRLRFYLAYRGVESLSDADKTQLRKISRFFDGRE